MLGHGTSYIGGITAQNYGQILYCEYKGDFILIEGGESGTISPENEGTIINS